MTIDVRPDLSGYTGSTRNGATTLGYGASGDSFTFPATKATAVTGAANVTAGDSGWGADTRPYLTVGAGDSFVCPPDGFAFAGTVWGSGSYTDDSSVCTAAVHAGLIGFALGGTVTVEVRDGLHSLVGSTSNGVTTKPYGAWHGTFVFVR